MSASVTCITAEQLAAKYGLSLATIWRLKRDRKIPFYQPGGPHGAVRFPDDAIERGTSAEPVSAEPPRPSESTPEKLARPIIRPDDPETLQATPPASKTKASSPRGPVPRWKRRQSK